MNVAYAKYKVPLHSCASKSTDWICNTNVLASSVVFGKLQASFSRIVLTITDLCKMEYKDTST